jgi:hypothetical protein
MTKTEFLSKYPEMNDDGNVSKFKINLLNSYSTHPLSNGDNKVKNMLEDYNRLVITENRDKKINTILLEQSLRRLKTSLLQI